MLRFGGGTRKRKRGSLMTDLKSVDVAKGLSTILSVILVLSVAHSAFAGGQFTNGAPASVVIGQQNFVTGAINSGAGTAGASSLDFPSGLVFDGSGELWVVDHSNYRVLAYAPPFANGANATVVLGQPNLTSNQQNNGASLGRITASSLGGPAGIAVDGSGNLWVTDAGANSRILRYSPPFTTFMAASLVLGEPDFLSNGSSVSQRSLNQPAGLAFDASGNLWVGDEQNNRVLRFDAPFANGAPATIVLGQPDFVSSATLNPPTGSSLSGPGSVAVDSDGNLWVADAGNHRVLRFSPPFSNGLAASLVIGQSSFTAHSGTNPPSSTSLRTPEGVAFDPGGRLWVVDTGNSRVLGYDPPFINGQAATVVIGQPDFVSNTAATPPTASSLSFPFGGVAIDMAHELWVADHTNSRVLAFAPLSQNLTLDSTQKCLQLGGTVLASPPPQLENVPNCEVSNLTLQSGFVLTISGEWDLLNVGTLNNAGEIVLSNSGFMTNGLVTSAGTQPGVVINTGTIHIDNGGSTAGGYLTNWAGTIENHNTVANGGSIQSTGAITNFSGATLTNLSEFVNYNSGTITNDAGGTIVNSAYNCVGTLSNQGVLSNAGTITNSQLISACGGVLDNVSGGRITNSGTITNTFMIAQESGATFNNDGLIVNVYCCGVMAVAPGGIFDNNLAGRIDNFDAIQNNGTINNPGTIVDECSGGINGPGFVSGNAVINNCGLPTSTTVTLSGGAGSADQTSTTGVSVGISGSTGTNATITSRELLVQPPSTSAVMLSNPTVFYDVNVSGITDGTATVCITDPFVTPGPPTATSLQYWDFTANGGSGGWVGTSTLVPPNSPPPPPMSIYWTVCANIPVSSLGGTPLVIGPVLGPAGAVQQLANAVNRLDLPHGMTTSLDAKLDAALHSIDAGKARPAVSQLEAFVQEVDAQTGKAIPWRAASLLTSNARRIIAVLSAGR